MRKFAVVVVMVSLLATGCVSLDLASDVAVLSHNQILASRSTIAEDSTINVLSKGDDAFDVTGKIPLLSAQTNDDGKVKIRALCDLHLISHNQLGVTRSQVTEGSIGEFDFDGNTDAKGNVEIK